ncbi:MAG: Eco57I restriction-modification methylase domain-containing protein, partial [Chloroflexota bacterium]
MHYLTERLPSVAEWKTDVASVAATIQKLYSKSSASADSWNEAQTEKEFVRPVLDALGWEYIPQVAHTKGGKRHVPDYVLFADHKTKTKAYDLQVSPDQFYPLALAICDAKYWGRALDAQSPNDERDTHTNANPSFQIINYLVGTDRSYGILTNGKVWRLYAQRVRSRTTTFFEIDVSQAIESKDEVALRFFILFFRCKAFQPDPTSGKSFLDRVLNESIEYAVKVQDELKELVFEKVAPLLVQGFVTWRKEVGGIETETPQTLVMLYKAALVVLYRLLFVFYAESRNLLPVRDAKGYGNYSLAKICRDVVQMQTEDVPLGLTAPFVWSRLEAIFQVIAKGEKSVGIPIYNGGLFSDQPLNGNVKLKDLKIGDRFITSALDLLARRYDKVTDRKNFIDYKDLDVRHLGSIYEGLLEFQPRFAEKNIAGDSKHALVKKGEVYLANDKGQRKSTGSYYTPDYVVKHIVTHTLGPVVSEREKKFRAQMEEIESLRNKMAKARSPETSRALRQAYDEISAKVVATLIDIRVCDPAMGSGHFLVEAVGYLTDRFAALLAEYPVNPLLEEIKAMRKQIMENLREQGIKPDPNQLDDKHLLKRMVIKRCIYGVDLNLMAVELAKLSLWLDSFTIGAPLSFLNHHLKHGNSVIGTRAETVQRELESTPARNGRKVAESTLQGHLFGSAFAGMLTATALMRDVANLTDATIEQVEQSAEKYTSFEREILPYKRVLDLWVSRHFGNQHAEDFLRLYGQDALQAVVGDESKISPQYREAMVKARTLYQEQRFFHWDLEFPEVFVDLVNSQWQSHAGFDVVISNPPYVDVSPDPYFRKTSHCPSSANLYAYMIETSGSIIAPNGRLGMIVPLSLVCSSRMEKLRGWFTENFHTIRVANFGIRPAKVFPNVDQRVTIVLAQRHQTGMPTPLKLHSTRLYHWHEGEELQLINNLQYGEITDLPKALGWPRVGDETGHGIAKKLFALKSKIGDHLEGKQTFYYHGIGRYWLKAYTFVPLYKKETGEMDRSSTLEEIHAGSPDLKHIFIGVINSSLFFWFWSLYGDEFHLMREEIASFPFVYDKKYKVVYETIQEKVRALMHDYKKNAILKEVRAAKGAVTIQEFYPRKSKGIIDEIDD